MVQDRGKAENYASRIVIAFADRRKTDGKDPAIRHFITVGDNRNARNPVIRTATDIKRTCLAIADGPLNQTQDGFPVFR